MQAVNPGDLVANLFSKSPSQKTKGGRPDRTSARAYTGTTYYKSFQKKACTHPQSLNAAIAGVFAYVCKVFSRYIPYHVVYFHVFYVVFELSGIT